MRKNILKGDSSGFLISEMSILPHKQWYYASHIFSPHFWVTFYCLYGGSKHHHSVAQRKTLGLAPPTVVTSHGDNALKTASNAIERVLWAWSGVAKTVKTNLIDGLSPVTFSRTMSKQLRTRQVVPCVEQGEGSYAEAIDAGGVGRDRAPRGSRRQRTYVRLFQVLVVVLYSWDLSVNCYLLTYIIQHKY